MRNRDLSDERIQFLKSDYERGFVRYCGFRAVSADWGRFQSHVQIQDDHRQQDGFIHAGVMATMADHTAGYSAFTVVPEGFQILSIEFKINFLRPAYGNALTCYSKVLRDGRRVIVAESEVFDLREGKEVPVAKAMVTLMAVAAEQLSRTAQESVS
jgi:uncharacterized protein (TIGR00369 family)